MPEMDGIELLSALKEQEVEAPLVMIWTKGGMVAMVVCVRMGEKPSMFRMTATKTKPPSMNKVITAPIRS